MCGIPFVLYCFAADWVLPNSGDRGIRYRLKWCYCSQLRVLLHLKEYPEELELALYIWQFLFARCTHNQWGMNSRGLDLSHAPWAFFCVFHVFYWWLLKPWSGHGLLLLLHVLCLDTITAVSQEGQGKDTRVRWVSLAPRLDAHLVSGSFSLFGSCASR